jgi:hypothetical protein
VEEAHAAAMGAEGLVSQGLHEDLADVHHSYKFQNDLILYTEKQGLIVKDAWNGFCSKTIWNMTVDCFAWCDR